MRQQPTAFHTAARICTRRQMRATTMTAAASAAATAAVALLAAGAGAQTCATRHHYASGQTVGLKAIYGPDSRQDEADTSECWRAIGRSTVARQLLRNHFPFLITAFFFGAHTHAFSKLSHPHAPRDVLYIASMPAGC